MEQKVKEVMASVFMMDIEKVDDNASPETIEAWDSLKQMNLILALEEEFDLEFSDDEVIEMLNYKLILAVIKNKFN